ncbi:MAG: GTPase Era [Thermoleophilaceae bacterium]
MSGGESAGRSAPSGEQRATRSGFVALAGRPNAGKSTLVNHVVGEKVAIVSDKPQTTRRAVRGIATGPDSQLVLVDLPGVQRPRDPMTERMQHSVERGLADADAVLFLLNGEQEVGKGDRFIARAIRTSGRAAVVAVNKVDRLSRRRTLDALMAAADLGIDGEVFPISARTGAGMPELTEHLVALLPEGPFLYPVEDRSDLPERVQLAELIREQVLLRTRDELPHAVEVDLGELTERDDGLLELEAWLWAEGESQKAILIGAGGSMVKAIGTAARKEIEAAVGRRVHLELRVRVRRAWRRDDGLLDRLGIE